MEEKIRWLEIKVELHLSCTQSAPRHRAAARWRRWRASTRAPSYTRSCHLNLHLIFKLIFYLFNKYNKNYHLLASAHRARTCWKVDSCLISCQLVLFVIFWILCLFVFVCLCLFFLFFSPTHNSPCCSSGQLTVSTWFSFLYGVWVTMAFPLTAQSETKLNVQKSSSHLISNGGKYTVEVLSLHFPPTLFHIINLATFLKHDIDDVGWEQWMNRKAYSQSSQVAANFTFDFAISAPVLSVQCPPTVHWSRS